MTLDTHRQRDRALCSRARVWLDDVEVTTRCFYADDRRGVVRLYRLNEAGKKFIEPILNAPHWNMPPRVAVEERRGHVRIQVGEP